ncbi:hypothetical protein K6121_00100 [Neisseria subflava]|uniref:hypothetical protein n=1 Tax=Neisseria subflava TaxID=28449 RepID=UPI001C99F488|nr:hypothetical protein [Neisseria subflava]MBY6284781.1 hypothetical protein [Neisseria subflava]
MKKLTITTMSLLTILTIILALVFIDNAEKEAELKEIQIIKEAENSNDPVLKQKAARMKAEIAGEEQAKQDRIENLQSEERLQELETIILTGLGVIFILFAVLGFIEIKSSR